MTTQRPPNPADTVALTDLVTNDSPTVPRDADSAPTKVSSAIPRDADLAPTQVSIAISLASLAAGHPRYIEGGVLGQGGMGEVGLVRDLHIGRDVALKQLRRDETWGEHDHARFEREARLQGQLEHPAIVPVYDLGARDDGSLYFTMKRVLGRPLSSVLAALTSGEPAAVETFTRRRLLTAFSQICLAAHYAHERGVIHRDIKPDNIMLGDYGEVYLLDWGIAKILSEEDRPSVVERLRAGDTAPTREGAVTGTAGYMSPEQAMGTQALVEATSDVYALGAILFEILTLNPLHERAPWALMIERTIAGVEARPSVRFPNVNVPPEIEEACVRATCRDVQQRLPSARALHDAIEAYLDGDRDLVLRLESAVKHAAAAAKAASLALEGTVSGEQEAAARTAAMREIGKALALDPGNRSALQTLVQLLTKPPRHVPREVEAEQQDAAQRMTRMGGLAGVFIYLITLLLGLFMFPMAQLDARWLYGGYPIWAGALVASIVTWRRPSYASLFLMFLCGTAAAVFNTTIYSPHLLVPEFLIVHAVLYALSSSSKVRIAVIVTACIGWTVSVFGAGWGIFPETVRFVNGGLFVRSLALRLDERSFTLYLYFGILAVIIISALVVGTLRRSYTKADLQLRLQHWQIHQLVGDKAIQAVTPPHA